MDKREQLKAIGMIRQAIKPLLDQIAVGDNLSPLLEKIEQRLSEKQTVDIPELHQLIIELSTISKHETVHKVEMPKIELPELTKLAEKLDSLTHSLSKSNNIADYRPHDQEEMQGTEYAGFVAPNGNWYIVRVQNNQQRYAFGKDDYEEMWKKRSKHDYSYLDKVMQ